MVSRRRKDDADDAGANQRHWYDKEPWGSILKLWPIILLVGGGLYVWVKDVNEVKRAQPEISKSLRRIERKLDVTDENTRRVANALSAHSGRPVVLLSRNATIQPDTTD